MSIEETEVVVVGAGQAGIAMSEHLGRHGVPHVVLERHRIAERWRTGRWDSLVANGPAWHDRFPSMEFETVGADEFATKDDIATYLEQYASQVEAPVRTGVDVTSVRKETSRPGFRVETSEGPINARFVVAATGPFQRPAIPPVVPDEASVHQIHSADYKNPQQLPDGGVLVVGAGSSGVQIADELNRAGRAVHLSVGPHDRPPRSYRGRDFVWWLGVLNKWEAATPPGGAEHVTIAVSGARGGETVDFRSLAVEGVHLLGRTASYAEGTVHFAEDLAANITRGDRNYLSLLDEADAYICDNGLDLPEEPEARELREDPESIITPTLSLDLARTGITTIIWATGFTMDYSWLPGEALDARGLPEHQRGISSQPGVMFLGLPWQSRRGSSFIWGVWHDARFLSDHIRIQRGYRAYQPTSAVALHP
jgi:putative flavoprotein involved in K+ transport